MTTSCRSPGPEQLPPEYNPTGPHTTRWQELHTVNPGNRQVPLNAGQEAPGWHQLAIDTATDSIDLRTFVWTFDAAGALAPDHRMHNQSMIIDNPIVIVGDRDLAGECFDLNTTVNFRDTELVVGGLIVDQISTAFASH